MGKDRQEKNLKIAEKWNPIATRHFIMLELPRCRAPKKPDL